MKIEVASVTHAGNVRTENQDRFLVEQDLQSGRPAVLLALADGMGGLARGEQASSLAVSLLRAWWQERNPAHTLGQVSESLDAAICEAHRQIFYLSLETGREAGSTLSLLYLQEGQYLIKQIGDSRVYCLENGQASQLTTDQTWCNWMIRTGALTPEEAEHHRLRHALVNALGVSPELEIATERGCLRRGASYLVCSDGFYHEASLEGLLWELENTSAQEALHRTMAQILSGKAGDNATAVLCRIW